MPSLHLSASHADVWGQVTTLWQRERGGSSNSPPPGPSQKGLCAPLPGLPTRLQLPGGQKTKHLHHTPKCCGGGGPSLASHLHPAPIIRYVGT